MKLYESLVLSIMPYGAETWPMRAMTITNMKRLERQLTTDGKYRFFLVSRGKIKYEMEKSEGEPGHFRKHNEEEMRKKCLHWFGHVQRMKWERLPNKFSPGTLESRDGKGKEIALEKLGNAHRFRGEQNDVERG